MTKAGGDPRAGSGGRCGPVEAGTDVDTAADESTRRLRSYLTTDLDDDDVAADIMGTERNV
ncbi:MAG: hypothetical protein U5R48_18085 [Gammaproteobacteria bacterium]|nr:hypothetical protein [Gammaproteobacteria bacterium]